MKQTHVLPSDSCGASSRSACRKSDSARADHAKATEKDSEYLLGCIEREFQWISGHPEDLYSTWACNSNSDLVEQYTVEAVLTHRFLLSAELVPN